MTLSNNAADMIRALSFHPPRSMLLSIEEEGSLLRHTGSKSHWCFETFALPPRDSEQWTVLVEYEGCPEEMEVMIGVVEERMNSGRFRRAM